MATTAATPTATARTEPAWRPYVVERAVASPPAPLPASTYRRRRAVAAGLVVVLGLAVWAALGALGGGPLPVPERPERLQPGTTYVVRPGDTVWSIAERLQPAGDPRPVVDRLVRVHGGPTLYVGERIPLVVP